MLKFTIIPTILLAALSCYRAEPSKLPAGIQFRWSTGDTLFEVDRNGRGTFEYQPLSPWYFYGAESFSLESKLTPEELNALEKLTVEKHACKLKSTGRHGIPDEARFTIAVKWNNIDCRVTMWSGEWHDDEDAAAIMRHVDQLLERHFKLAERIRR